MARPTRKGPIRYDKQKQGKSQVKADPPTTTKPAIPARRQPVQSAPPSPVVTLEPLAPLIVRSGRPFDEQTGADPARFPPPSTLAGCLRTAWARANGEPFGHALLGRLTVAGPLLLRPTANGQARILVPKPADAHYFGHEKEARCVRAEPQKHDKGCDSDLPKELLLLRLNEKIEGKASQEPAWWAWEDLIAFRRGEKLIHKDLTERGWSPPKGDRRTHVAIDAATLAAETGRLFQTEGLDLEPDNPRLKQSETTPLRLLARCTEPLSEGLVHLGGERRLARLHPEPETVWPSPPANWFAAIQQAGGLTLTLLTPACFDAGYRPGWLDDQLTGAPPIAPGVRLKLIAAAVERWQPHSGWDLFRREPRPTRKLVGAGATYWFRLLELTAPEALAPLWLASLCDLEQDRRDGYGLALPAPWTPPTDAAITR